MCLRNFLFESFIILVSVEISLKEVTEKMPVHLMTGQFKMLQISLPQLYWNWDCLWNPYVSEAGLWVKSINSLFTIWTLTENVYWLLLYTIGTVLFTISSHYFHTVIKWLTFLWVHKSLSGSFLHLKCCFSFCSYLKSIFSSRYDSIEVFSSKVLSNSLWPYGL